MSRHTHIMCDIETFGRHENSRILTIGACLFIPESKSVVSRFYCALKAPEHPEIVEEPETVAWWEKQKDSPAYNEAVHNPNALDYTTGLTSFAEWVMQRRMETNTPETCMWANDPDFDMKILLSNMATLGILAPWQYFEHRSCRTMECLGRAYNIIRKRDFKRAGVHHNALDDAIYQASYVSAIWNAIHAGSKLTIEEDAHV